MIGLAVTRPTVAMFVLNDLRHDSRVRREAAALVANGYEVTVYAVMSDATAHLATEAVDGFRIVRLPMLMRPTSSSATLPGATRSSVRRRALASVFAATRPLFGGALHFVANWQLRWSSWARQVVARVEPADIWHAHDLNALGAAAACAERHGGALVYDSHEIFVEAGATSALPGMLKAAIRSRERAWARGADAVLTVNESIAEVLRRSLDTEVSVVRNCAPPPARGESPLRARIGLGDDVPVAMYHGSITVGRGIELLVAAMADPRLAGAHLVIMGFGPLRPSIEQQVQASPARERIHLLPPVAPADVTWWVSGADVAVMPIEPTTLNHRLSSPNKLFEALAAGVPVVGPDFPEFRRVVTESSFGALGRLHADHAPATVATAIHELLSLDAGQRDALRARCRSAAAAEWNWDAEARRLLGVYRGLQPRRSETARPFVAPGSSPVAGK